MAQAEAAIAAAGSGAGHYGQQGKRSNVLPFAVGHPQAQFGAPDVSRLSDP